MSEQEMTLSQAAAECGKWGNLIRALSKVEESAKVVLGVEQNIAERTALRDKLGAEIAAAQAQLLLETGAVERARADARDIAEGARSEATSIKADARSSAERIVADARAAAEAAQAAARQANADRDQAVAEAASAKAELADTLKRIDAARAEARKLFGGP